MILKYNVFTLMWAVIILLLTLLAGGASSNIEMVSLDKVIHCSIFAVQSFLLIVGLKKQHSYSYLKFNAGKVSILATTVFGILVESIQGIIPARSFEWTDMLANMAGAFIGFLVFLLIYKTRLT